jgi:hypothetical protein
MESKDFIALIGIVVSLIVGGSGLIIGILNSRKTIYINSVTSLRTKWLDNIKTYLSEFCGLTYNYTLSLDPTKDQRDVVEKIDKLRFLIKLNLNPNDKFDQKLMEKIDKIPNLTNPKKLNELTTELNELTRLSQKMAKHEWEGIKAEAREGILSDVKKKTLREKYLDD